MILLDQPLVSNLVKQSIRSGLFPAMDTGNILEPGELELFNEKEAIQHLTDDPDVNLHTISENALKWIYDKLKFTSLPQKISLFKDKYAFRQMTADMFPAFFFRKVLLNELGSVDINTLPFPFILKPNTGFFSMGIYKVFDEQGWEKARASILADIEHISSIYPNEVLSLDSYIIEEVINGKEYAFDAYYDDAGNAHILGVLEHPFSGDGDVSDRVYNTSARIVREYMPFFEKFLKDLGRKTKLKNFSLHVEVRIDDGQLVPIEVNPLRFGAWCTSADLAHYAFGINPYSMYINKVVPEWDKILEDIDDSIYSIIILDNSSGMPGYKVRDFNYSAVLEKLSHVLELRKTDYKIYPIFGILFVRSRPEDYHQIEQILHDDLKNYVII